MQLDSEAAGFPVTGISATSQAAFRLHGSARIEILIFTFLLSPPVSPCAQSPQSGATSRDTLARLAAPGESLSITVITELQQKPKGVKETILTCEMLYRYKCINNLILKGPLNSQNEKAKPLMMTSEEHMGDNADKPQH